MTRSISFLLIVCSIFIVCCAAAQAQITLTGAQIYAAGDNTNGAFSGGGYRYTTNSADGGGFALSTNEQDEKAISIPLELGDNVFSFSGTVAPADPGNYVGLSLFFTDTDSVMDNSFNPDTTSGVAGDLTVFTQMNSLSNSFSTVAAGIQTQTYDAGAIGAAFANGQQSFTFGSVEVSVTAFTVSNSPFNPSGSFTLTVTPLEDVTLTGAQIYAAGDNTNGAFTGGQYRYTTNSADDNGFALSINGQDEKAISIPLGSGDHVFSFSGTVAPADPGNYVGLSLFFTDNDSTLDNSFNPETTSGVAGDLTVFTQMNSPSNSFSTVTAGIQTQTYDIDATGSAFANGQQSFAFGSVEVSVTAFSVSNSTFNPSGSFTLTVTPLTLLGDVNLDGSVNFLDIAPFIAVLANEGFQAEADIDQTGVVNFLDIARFIELLSSQ